MTASFFSLKSKWIHGGLVAIHGITSILITVLMFKCNTQTLNEHMYGVYAYSFSTFTERKPNVLSCNSTMQCYRDAKPWDNNYMLHQTLFWNPYTLMLLIECITTGFCTLYLIQDLQLPKYKRLALIAPLLGFLLYCVFAIAKQQNNWPEILIATAVTSASVYIIVFYDEQIKRWIELLPKENWHTPEKVHGITWYIPCNFLNTKTDTKDEPKIQDIVQERMQVVLRYLEYTLSAPLLYIVIVCLLVVGPPYWTVLIGYTCMLGCCLSGIPLHIMHILEICIPLLRSQDQPQRTDKKTPLITTSCTNNGKLLYVQKYDNTLKNEDIQKSFILSWLLIGKWRSNWVCKLHFLQMAWFALVMALTFPIYIGKNILFTSIIPTYVLVALWNMLVLYMSFGAVSTVYYYLVDKKYWQTMPYALDILSFAAKIPIIYSLCIGYLTMPGNTCT